MCGMTLWKLAVRKQHDVIRKSHKTPLRQATTLEENVATYGGQVQFREEYCELRSFIVAWPE